jgi:hypothetical protein
MDRREFLRDAAQFVLVLPFGTFLVRCKTDDGKSTGSSATEPDETAPALPPKIKGTNVVFTTSLTNDHSHSFTVPLSAFESPPMGGITGYTTESKGHQHSTTIDQDTLQRAESGDEVKVETGKAADDHTHTFTIVKMR